MNRRIRRISLALALSIVAALGANASSARAATGMELALQDDAVFVTQAYLGHEKGFQLLDELKVKWLRVNVPWSSVMPASQSRTKTKPSNVAFDFTAYDILVSAAAARGVQIEMGLTGSAPAWATGNKKVGPDRPKADLFREFVRAAVNQFKGKVTRYSIWNEPNHTGWLAPLKSQASLYRQLYLAGYAEIKQIDPAAQVLIAETAPYASRRGVAQPPLTFMKAVTKAGGLKADGFAHHPYDLNGNKPTYQFPGKDNVTIGTLSRLTKFLDSVARSNKLETEDGRALDLYLTEFGYLRSGRKKIAEKTRVKYLQQSYDIALKNKRVRQMLHFLIAQPTKKYLFFDTSLTDRKGKKTASFNALAAWANKNASKVNTR